MMHKFKWDNDELILNLIKPINFINGPSNSEIKYFRCDHCKKLISFDGGENLLCQKCSRIGRKIKRIRVGTGVDTHNGNYFWDYHLYPVNNFFKSFPCNCKKEITSKLLYSDSDKIVDVGEVPMRVWYSEYRCVDVCGTKNLLIYLNRDAVFKYYKKKMESERHLYLSFIAKPLFETITPNDVKKVFAFSNVNKAKDFLK